MICMNCGECNIEVKFNRNFVAKISCSCGITYTFYNRDDQVIFSHAEMIVDDWLLIYCKVPETTFCHNIAKDYKKIDMPGFLTREKFKALINFI